MPAGSSARRRLRQAAIGISLPALMACQTTQSTQEIVAIAQPSAPPVQTQSLFRESLRCMDLMLGTLALTENANLAKLRPSIATGLYAAVTN